MTEHQCILKTSNGSNATSLTSLLLCLENRLRTGKILIKFHLKH